MGRHRLLTGLLALVYFGILAGLAFMPSTQTGRSLWFWPMIAFVPVGILLALLLGRRRWWAAIAFGVLGAAWIEAAQFAWMPAAYADSMDVVWASAGVGLGVAITVTLTTTRASSRAVARPRQAQVRPAGTKSPSI